MVTTEQKRVISHRVFKALATVPKDEWATALINLGFGYLRSRGFSWDEIEKQTKVVIETLKAQDKE